VFQFLRRKTKEIPPEQTDETSLRDTEQPSWLADKSDTHKCVSVRVCLHVGTRVHTALNRIPPPFILLQILRHEQEVQGRTAFFSFDMTWTVYKMMLLTILRCRRNMFTEFLPSNAKGIHRQTYRLFFGMTWTA
jgi:hypothetical protein